VLLSAIFAPSLIGQVSTGIDVLEQQNFRPLKEIAAVHGGHLRLGVLTNPVGIDAHEQRTIDVLRIDAASAVPGLSLVTLFSAFLQPRIVTSSRLGEEIAEWPPAAVMVWLHEGSEKAAVQRHRKNREMKDTARCY
jgi:hypothetical protein